MSPYTRWSNFRNSFQSKLFLIFTLLTFLVTSLLCTLYITNEAHKTRLDADEKLLLMAKQLADSIRLPLYAENSDMLRQLAELAARAPEIRAVVISAPDGRVLAEIRGHIPDTIGQTGVISQSVEVRSNPLVSSIESSMTDSSDTRAPLLGTVRIEQGTVALSRAIFRIFILSVCLSVIFWLAVILLSYPVLRRLTHSFNSLLHGINTLEKGDYNSRIVIESDDEVGKAAYAVNELASALRKRSEENAYLMNERLNLERQILNSQKLESLGVMAGGIAHDFNNLLQSILGNMELASRELPPDSKPKQYISNAMISGKHAANLSRMMLTYAGKGFVAKKEMNLNDLVRENIEMLKSAASSAVTMELSISEELPNIKADEAQIQQLIMNLITNAAESIEKPPGFVRITTGIRNCDETLLSDSLLDEKQEPGNYVCLEVTDNGCGMNEETLKRLFDPFFTTKFTGRGLGMSAVLGIMKTHGGAFFVESEPGKGTTFRALFPASESAQPATAHPHPHPEGEGILREAKKSSLSGLALLVDDEKTVLKICDKMVKLCGFTVITATDGLDAIAKYRDHADEISVVLMDLTMPNMDGITAMNEIYGIRPDAKVILSSGYNREELSESITGQPPSGFIRKPYNMDELEAELKRVVLGI